MSSPTRISPVYVSAGTPGGAGPSGDNCPGCGAPATGRFCANCGQRTTPPPLSLRLLLRDYLDDSFSLNTTLPRTLGALFFRPGHLTREYLRHRVSPYVPPFRLYLVTSLIFFIVIALRARPVEIDASDRAQIDSVRAVMRDSADARAARGDTVITQRFGITFDPGAENWTETVVVNLGNETVNRIITTRLQAYEGLEVDQAMTRIMRGVIENTPKVMFLLLPLYALLLKLLYVRSKHYYAEHFVFALHGHAFAFSLFVLLMLPGIASADYELPGWVGEVAALLLLWLMVYYWVALKRVYQQGWFRTTVKWMLLGQLYAIVVGVGLLLAFMAAVFTV